MELSNETKLRNLLSDINRKTERLVYRSIVKTAINKDINVKEVSEKYAHKIQNYRDRMKLKLTNEHQKEIDWLKQEIEKEKDIAESIFKTHKVKPKPSVKASVRPKRKIKKVRKNKNELNTIKEMMFAEQLGYKEIASLLRKDEEEIKKIVVKIMCESVA